MEPLLQQGKDILYLGFTSGLSATYSSSRVAVEELKKSYPEAEILTVDTLCASLGQGLLLYLTAQEKAKGKSISEVRDFAEDNKMRVCHWFTVEDLKYLKRGGRITAASAFVGTVLSIKPVMHVDNEGHLLNVRKGPWPPQFHQEYAGAHEADRPKSLRTDRLHQPWGL